MITIDFETYSHAGYCFDKTGKRSGGGLRDVGMAKYAEHPSTDVLCLAYDLGDGNIKSWMPKFDENFIFRHPEDLLEAVRQHQLIEAWNVGFEYWIWEKVCTRKYGWPKLSPNQLRCAAAKARIFCIPGSLGEAGKVLKLTNQKNKIGSRLIDKFSTPHKFNRTSIADSDFKNMLQYNIEDVQAEIEASSMMPNISSGDLENWQLDQAINQRGVKVDLDLINKCHEVVKDAHLALNQELKILTDGEVTSSGQLARIMKWAKEKYGYNFDSLTQKSITELLTHHLIDPIVKQVLEIRQQLKSAAVRKLVAMKDQACADGRIRELFTFHGAHTGRTTGNKTQPQNLPNNSISVGYCPYCNRYTTHTQCSSCAAEIPSNTHEWNSSVTEQILDSIDNQEVLAKDFANPLNMIAQCLRGLFIAAPGHRLICSDYSAIEAVALAMLAQEQWRIDVFKTHGKIYEASAARITGTPLEEILKHKTETGQHHPLRKLGKIAELASGYQGGVGSWKNFGADKYFDSEEQIKRSVYAWRDANKNIVKFWYDVENAAKNALNHPDEFWLPRRDLNIAFYKPEHENYLTVQLPSNRMLYYQNCKLQPKQGWNNTWEISYETWNTNPLKGKKGWIRVSTYGGKLVENIIQAATYDILAHAIKTLERNGYSIVLQVHDELVAEVLKGFGSLKEFELLMSLMPSWAVGWPIRAQGGWEGQRYRK